MQIALFIDRARVLQQWNDDIMFVKERLNKDVVVGKEYTHRAFNYPDVMVSSDRV